MMPFHSHDHESLDPREEAEEGLMPCPYCLAAIYDDAERCPQCGEYLSREDGPSRKPRWILVTALVAATVAIAQAFLLWP